MAINEANYSGSYVINEPKGIWQAAGDTNLGTEYAYRAENIRTERGLLASAKGTRAAFPSLGYPVKTLTRFYRRNRPDDAEVYVAAANGRIFTYTAGAAGWVQRASGFESDKWSYVTYETVRSGQTVDVLLMSNAQDGMIVVYGDNLSVERKAPTIGSDYVAVHFSQMGRYAERIWGITPEYPDKIFYSRAYEALNWTANVEAPELGGGEISQPTWDGDSFIAIVPFGGYLLALKQHTAFELRGTDPSSFTIQQSFGTDGPLEADSLCTDRTTAYFLSEGGVGMYDGSTLRLLSRDALYETMRMRMPGLHTATATMCRHVYYLALPVRNNESDVITANNAVIEFDTERGTFMLRKGLRVADFYALGEKVYFAQADAPYDIFEYNADVSGYNNEPMQCLWETAWLDLGKSYRKKDFELRFTADADVNDTPISLTLATDRREKTRVRLLQSDRRDFRVKIQLTGRRVKLKIESETVAGWQIYGGVEVRYSISEE